MKVSLHRARQLLLDHVEQHLLPDFRRQFAFDGARCDRLTGAVMARVLG